jgi:hypothetical protein
MTPALTPAVALDYLHELSADIDAGVILDADGTLLAGPEDLAPAARDLLDAAGDATDVHVTTGDRAVFAAQDGRHAIVLTTGRFALPSLARYDLRMVLADLAGEGKGKGADARARRSAEGEVDGARGGQEAA